MREGVAWTNKELQVAVETYLFLFRLQEGGYRISESELVRLLSGGPLARRNEASLRYRFRNISAVLADHGHPILRAYSPAPRVGAGVRARLEAILFSNNLSLPSREEGTSITPDMSSAEKVLTDAEAALHKALAALERTVPENPLIGHNRPPDVLQAPIVDDLRDAISAVQACRADLATDRLTAEKAKRGIQVLVRFGVRAAGWAGERLTKATDAALNTAVRAGVLALIASLPPVAKAIEALFKLL